MRKFLFVLTALAGAAAAAGSAKAIPMAAHPAPASVLRGAPQGQTVQYYEDWRTREWRRREAYERHRRREEGRRWHGHERGGYRAW